jgi:folate-binding protein YgfZ
MTLPDFDLIFDEAVLGAVQPRAQLAVAGADRASFLQGFLTNDIQALEPGTGCYAAWLTPQGRMLTDMHVLSSASMVLLDLPQQTAQATAERLEQFHFSEDVTISALAESLTSVWMHGPRAASALGQVLNGAEELAQWAQYRHQPLSFDDVPVVVARIDQLGVPGYCLFLPPSHAPRLADALVAAGVHRASPGAIEAARIEAGYPLFGVDMSEDTIPLEAGIEGRAISLTKGCYVGQEVIIRVLHRGHGRVAKKLVRLEVDGAAEPGAALRSGEREVGRVTSAAHQSLTQQLLTQQPPTQQPPTQPLPARSVALAYVQRDFVQPGTELVVGYDVRARVAVGRVLRE